VHIPENSVRFDCARANAYYSRFWPISFDYDAASSRVPYWFPRFLGRA